MLSIAWSGEQMHIQHGYSTGLSRFKQEQRTCKFYDADPAADAIGCEKVMPLSFKRV